MKAVLLSTFVASAAAFAPSQQTAKTSSLNAMTSGFGPEPIFIGDKSKDYFDPVGFMEVRIHAQISNMLL
jgi:hypothetical protein